jgi:hypothetical protein
MIKQTCKSYIQNNFAPVNETHGETILRGDLRNARTHQTSANHSDGTNRFCRCGGTSCTAGSWQFVAQFRRKFRQLVRFMFTNGLIFKRLFFFEKKKKKLKKKIFSFCFVLLSYSFTFADRRRRAAARRRRECTRHNHARAITNQRQHSTMQTDNTKMPTGHANEKKKHKKKKTLTLLISRILIF